MKPSIKRIDNHFLMLSTSVYSPSDEIQARQLFDQACQDALLAGSYDDDHWIMTDRISIFTISFSLDEDLYNDHGLEYTGMEYSQIIPALKCFVVRHLLHQYTGQLLREITRQIQRYLESISDLSEYQVSRECIYPVMTFMTYLGLSKQRIDHIKRTITRKRQHGSIGQRQLQPMILYAIIDRELDALYESDHTEDKLFYFCVWFWSKVSMILPLRPTEMLLTPWNLTQTNKDYRITVRRSRLKGHSFSFYVSYTVGGDYKEHEFRLPEKIISVINWYKGQFDYSTEPDYLFDFVKIGCTSPVATLNARIRKFVQNYIIGNHSYDFARYVAEVDEFEPPHAGDSRVIALTNLYFSDSGPEICMALAGHKSIETARHYYTNIAQSISASACMKVIRRHERERSRIDHDMTTALTHVSEAHAGCTFPCRSGDELLNECKKQRHLEDCFGCPHYAADPDTIARKYNERLDVLNNDIKRAFAYITRSGDEMMLSDGLSQALTIVEADKFKLAESEDIRMEQLFRKHYKILREQERRTYGKKE